MLPSLVPSDVKARYPNDKTGQIKDEQTIGFIKQQLAAFAQFITRIGGKSLD